MALTCLGSLLCYSAEPLCLRVHDDGTLTAEDLERLAAGLAGPEVVSRAEADERLAPFLAGHPAARAYRDENPLGLKLLDVPLLAGSGVGGGELAYCDADVLFLRPFDGLFELPPQAGALFMSDVQNAYSLRSWHLVRRRLALPARANTGIVLFRSGLYDLDLVEGYLARPEHRFAPVWVEQTAWALLGWRAGCRLLDPQAVAIATADPRPVPARVALHFVSSARHLLAAAAAAAPDRRGEPPVAVRSLPAEPCGAVALARTEAGRVWRRLAGR